MARREVEVVAGGPQGSGLETVAEVASTALASLGYSVVSAREYHSNIIGRHSYTITRVSSDRLLGPALRYPADIVLAMDAETIFTHYSSVKPGGVLVYDRGEEAKKLSQIQSMYPHTRERIRRELESLGVEPIASSVLRYLEAEKGVTLIGLDYKTYLSWLRREYNIPPLRLQRYRSGILVGAVAGLLGIDRRGLERGFSARFRGRESIVRQNLALAERVAEEVSSKTSDFVLEEPKLGYGEYFVVSGNDIVAMGKVAGGMRFQSYYPITPAQDESFFLEQHETLEAGGEQLGPLLVFQTEDEIAAAGAAIGAALAGARAATATSGPGFDLMAESMSWAGMTETPLVITLYQRAGPSTGMPTRGEQADLLAAMFSGHGDFPRIVLASGDHWEAFRDAIMAFNLAERYQTVVVHVLDKFLANTYTVVPPSTLVHPGIDRGNYTTEPGEGYKRYSTGDTLPARAPLGSTVIWYTGNEHDEEGHIVEDPEYRLRMHRRRMEKLRLADREIPVEERAKLYLPRGTGGPEDLDLLLVGWGMVKPVALEAIEASGSRAGYLHLRYFSPFPASYVEKILRIVGPERTVCVEHNYSLQACKLVAMNTGIRVERRIVKYTGRPIYVDELIHAISEILKGAGEVVLRAGA